LNSHSFVGSSAQLFSKYSAPVLTPKADDPANVRRSISDSSHMPVAAYQLADLMEKKKIEECGIALRELGACGSCVDGKAQRACSWATSATTKGTEFITIRCSISAIKQSRK
jgi:hypothetical protein